MLNSPTLHRILFLTVVTISSYIIWFYFLKTKWEVWYCFISQVEFLVPTLIINAENYKPRFPISSGAPCALASLFTPVQHFLGMLVHYLASLSYKPVQTTSLYIILTLALNSILRLLLYSIYCIYSIYSGFSRTPALPCTNVLFLLS